MRQLNMVLALLIPFIGCGRFHDRHLDRAVQEQELYGVFRMNPASVNDLRTAGYDGAIDSMGHRITIATDGVCLFETFTQLPSVRSRALDSISSSCTWRLSTSLPQTLFLDLANGAGSAHYEFDETSLGQLILWQYITDPDAAAYVEYIKE